MTEGSGDIVLKIDSDLQRKSQSHFKNRPKIPELNLGFVQAKNDKN